MKTLIENIQHFSLHDGPGTRTTVFFKGCPLACLWCSNPTTQKYTEEMLFKEDICIGCQKCSTVCPQKAISYTPKVHIDQNLCNTCKKCIDVCQTQALVLAGTEYTVEEVFNIIKKDIMFYQNSGGGVTFSGGEMLSHAPFVLELIEKCKKINIHTCAETSGFGRFEDLKQIIEKLNMVFFDVKHIDNTKHKEITGKENTTILKNLENLLAQTHTPIHVRLPLIPTLNDDDEHLIKYAKYMSNLKGIADLEILPYHRLGSSKYAMLGREYALSAIQPSTSEHLKAKVELMRTHATGLKVICTG